MEDGKNTLYELIIGIILFMFIELFICLYFVDDNAKAILGTVVGAVLAVFVTYSMYKTIGAALDMEEESAKSYSKKNSMLRLLVIIAVLTISILLSKFISVIMVFIGIMNLKFAAYIQPLTHRFTKKFFD